MFLRRYERRSGGRRRTYWALVESVRTGRGSMTLMAYNDMLPVKHPVTGKLVHLVALGTRHPKGGPLRNPNELGASGWYLVRCGEGDYGIGRVFDPANPIPNPPRGLTATGTIEVSPFPEDAGRAVYFGGFDCAKKESHNTAWIYRGQLESRPSSSSTR